MSAYYILGIMLSTLYTLFHFILKITLEIIVNILNYS